MHTNCMFILYFIEKQNLKYIIYTGKKLVEHVKKESLNPEWRTEKLE